MSLGVPSSCHTLEEVSNTQKMPWPTFQGPSSPLCRCPAHGPPALSAPSAVGSPQVHGPLGQSTACSPR